MTLNRGDWSKCFGKITDKDLLNKSEMINDSIYLMLSRSQDIFKYGNMPDTIEDYVFERCLQGDGHATIFKDNEDKLRVDVGQLGGLINQNYEFTQSNIANPFLEVTKTFYIQDVNGHKKDCVVVRNDAYFNDLITLFKRNATLESEAYLTMQYQMIYGRLPLVLIASSEPQKKAFEEMLEKVIKGEKISALIDNKLFEGMRGIDSLSINKPDDLLPLMELGNYFKAKSFNDIGLNANFNMKREAINSSESGLNRDGLIPYIQQMLKWRKKGIEEVNSFFGTNITVELNDLWQEKINEIDGETEPEMKEETTQETEKSEVISNEI